MERWCLESCCFKRFFVIKEDWGRHGLVKSESKCGLLVSGCHRFFGKKIEIHHEDMKGHEVKKTSRR